MEPVAATLPARSPVSKAGARCFCRVLALILGAVLVPWLRLGHRAGVVRTNVHLCGVTDVTAEAARAGTASLYESPDAVIRRALFVSRALAKAKRLKGGTSWQTHTPYSSRYCSSLAGSSPWDLGLALKGADRRVAARLQGRVGPPLAQPFFDIVKLGFKRTMVPDTACETVFLSAPLVGTASMLVAVALIPIAGVYSPDPQMGNLLVLLYLLAIPGVALMVAGSASGSPYGAIGFSREMALMLAYEGPIVLVVTAVALRTGLAEGHWPTFSLAEIVRYQQMHGAFILDPVMWPAAAAFAFFYPANLGIVPFDIPEAETEVLEGPLLEYSGPALALFKVMSALKAVVVLSLGVALFMPLPIGGVAALAGWAAQLLVLVLIGVTAVRVASGRMRIDQAFIFFLKWPLLLATVSVAVAAYYTAGGAL